MLDELSYKQAFCYYRMGLVTGLVEIHELIEWADAEIMKAAILSDEIMELSLSGRQPYSRLIYMLNAYQGEPDYGRPLELLLERARQRFEDNPRSTREIIMGLRLLNAETYLPNGIRHALFRLDEALEQSRQGLLQHDSLESMLKEFLSLERF